MWRVAWVPAHPKLGWFDLLPFLAKRGHGGQCGTGKNPKGCHMSRPQNLGFLQNMSKIFFFQNKKKAHTQPDWSGLLVNLNQRKPKFFLHMQIFRSASPNLRKWRLFSGLDDEWSPLVPIVASWLAGQGKRLSSKKAIERPRLKVQFDSRFASFQQILACRFHATKKNNKQLEILGGFLVEF